MNTQVYLDAMKERDKAISTLNPIVVRNYCKKHNIPIPPDRRVFMAGIYKAAYFILEDTVKKESAKKWLLDNGFTTDISTPYFKIKNIG